MAEALYGPEGYYTRRSRLGGQDADFFTSPELHPAFGGLLGRFAFRVWHALGRPSRFEIVEHGPGTGALCRDLLEWAEHRAPAFARTIHYRLVETSPLLRAAQRATLESAGSLSDRIAWSEPPSSVASGDDPADTGSAAPPGGESRANAHPGVSTGLILANELVDALPVHIVAVRNGQLRERYVTLQDETLGWLEDEPSTPELERYFERLGLLPGEGCIAEVNLAGATWLEQTALTLQRGALLVLDYGYPAPDLYAPERRFGTLLTYRQHTLGSDPLVHVGAQDITSHVDFTSLARAGECAGLGTVGLISQASLLGRLGLAEIVRAVDRSILDAWAHEANRRALQALAEPSGLGRVQALLQTRGLPGFDPFANPDGEQPGWVPVLRPGQMRLPGPLEAEGFVDLEGQWRELFGDADLDASPG